jgi:hypothetical protein
MRQPKKDNSYERKRFRIYREVHKNIQERNKRDKTKGK